MSTAKTLLSRDEFYLLHFLIDKECDRLLIQEGKEGLNKVTEQCFYGFLKCEPDMEFAGEDYPNSSIKYVILAKLGDEIKFNRKKYGFRLDHSENIMFDGRYLCNLKNRYNAGDEEIAIQTKYLLVFLKLLDADSMEALKERYKADNGETHHGIVEEWIAPTKNSRQLKGEDEEEEPLASEPASQEDETPGKWPQYQAEEKLESRFRLLEHTDWYYYQFDHKNQRKAKSILRKVLRIGRMLENGDLEIELIAQSDTFSDYAGRISKSDSNEKILICRLSTKDIGAKLKTLMFHIDPRVKSKIYLGQYLEYDDNYSIMSGTLLISKIPDSNEISLGSRSFVYGSEEMDKEVPPAIRQYFEDKNLNFTESPTGISTFYDLTNWLERERAPIEHPSKIYDLYISVPFVELQNNLNKLKELEQVIYQMLDDPILKSIGIDKSKIYHRTVKKNQLYDSDYLLKRDQRIIQKSKAFLFVFPQEKKILTSVFIQAGYAVHGRFPTFILYKDIDCLPYSLQVAKELDHVKMRKIESFADILKFPEWVKVNEHNRLYEDAN